MFDDPARGDLGRQLPRPEPERWPSTRCASALADLGSISERRTFRLLSPTLNGRLPAFLTTDAGTSSGYMVLQYTAAALVAELRALAHPVSVDSIPTSDNQEDHVSMGMTAALMAIDAVDRLEKVVAIELLCACQALDCDPGRAGRRGGGACTRAVRELVPTAHARTGRPPMTSPRCCR